MALDPERRIETDLRYPRGDRAETLLQLGARERLADAPVRAEPKGRVHPWLVGAANVEPVRIAVGGLVAHRRHHRKHHELAGRYLDAVDPDVIARDPHRRRTGRLEAQRFRDG